MPILGSYPFPAGWNVCHRVGRGPRVVVSTTAFHARVRGSFAGLGGLKETNIFLPHPLVKPNIVGSLRHLEVACSASDLQGFNLESCVWRAVSSHHPHWSGIVSGKLDYRTSFFHNMPEKDITRLQRVQNCLARVITKAPRFTRYVRILKRLHCQVSHSC